MVRKYGMVAILLYLVLNNGFDPHLPLSKVNNLRIDDDRKILFKLSIPGESNNTKMAIGLETKALLHGEFIQQIGKYKEETMASISN